MSLTDWLIDKLVEDWMNWPKYADYADHADHADHADYAGYADYSKYEIILHMPPAYAEYANYL